MEFLNRWKIWISKQGMKFDYICAQHDAKKLITVANCMLLEI